MYACIFTCTAYMIWLMQYQYSLTMYECIFSVRRKYILIFSIEILMTIQSNEHHLLSTFERHRRIDRNKAQGKPPRSTPDHFVIAALEKIKIVPQKVSRTENLQLVDDILPRAAKLSERELTYPPWEWVLCIVAVKAVINALGRNSSVREAIMKVHIRFNSLLTSSNILH